LPSKFFNLLSHNQAKKAKTGYSIYYWVYCTSKEE